MGPGSFAVLAVLIKETFLAAMCNGFLLASPLSRPVYACSAGLIFFWFTAVGRVTGEETILKKPICKGPEQLIQDLSRSLSVAGYNALGAYFAKQKNFSCAIEAFRAGLELDPKSWEARYNLGLALRDDGKRADAAHELQEAILQKPDFVAMRIALGTILTELEQSDAAVEQYKEALKLDSRSVDALYNLANILVSQGKYNVAIHYLRQASTVEPKDASVRLGLALALAQNGEIREAIDILERLVATNPKYSQAHFNLGTLYTQDHRYEEAAREYGEAMGLEPSNDTARLSRAKALLVLGKYEAVLDALREYDQRNVRNYEANYLAGAANRGLGNYGEAERKLKLAFELNPPGDDKLHFEMGVVKSKLGKLEEGRNHLEIAKRLNPRSEEVRFHLANVLLKLRDDRASEELRAFQNMKDQSLRSSKVGALTSQAGLFMEQENPRGAVSLYQEALGLDPNDAKIYYNLSLALDKLGDQAAEMRALEKAIESDPQFARAHNRLGLLYLAHSKLGLAQREFEAASRIDPQFAEADNNLGVVLGRQGKNREAETKFRQAVEDNPNYAEAFVNLALILAAQGQFAAAEKELKTALTLSPKHIGGLTALGKLRAKLGRPRESIEAFREVVALVPGSAEARLNLGIALADSFNLREALSEFSEAVRLAPDSAAAHYNKGRVLLDLRRPEARAELEAAVRLAPNLADALYLLAIGEKQGNRFDRSAELLRKVVTLQPQNAAAHFLLGQNLARVNDTVGAVAAWNKAIESKPDYLEAWHELCQTLDKTDPPKSKECHDNFAALSQRLQITSETERLGNFAQASFSARDWSRAAQQLQEALQICHKCLSEAELHRNLGLIFCRWGDYKNAERELGLALELKPHDAEASRALNLVKGRGNISSQLSSQPGPAHSR